MIKLKPGEQVKIKVRKHVFILFEHVAVLGIIFIAPFLLFIFITSDTISAGVSETIFTAITPALFIFIGAAWSLFIWMKLAAIWTDYHLDMWVVTDSRVIDVEQKGFFHREIATLQVEQIQDVTVEIKGIFSTILNFGTIRVQTAAASREFTIRGIPNPKRVKEIILKQHALRIEQEEIK